MIVDLHLHTSCGSTCSVLEPQELINRARALGLDAVAITEHGVAGDMETMSELYIQQGIIVFPGIEVHTPVGDVLAFGLEGREYHDVDFFELMEEVDRCDAAAVLAHPARGHWGHRSRFKGTYPDEVYAYAHAVETHNGQCTRKVNYHAAALCARFGLPSTGGSDAHRAVHVGRCVMPF